MNSFKELPRLVLRMRKHRVPLATNHDSAFITLICWSVADTSPTLSSHSRSTRAYGAEVSPPPRFVVTHPVQSACGCVDESEQARNSDRVSRAIPPVVPRARPLAHPLPGKAG